MNPSNFSTFACETSIAIVLAAQITVSGGSGGQVHYTWNINHVATTANITFAPGQTSQAVNDTINNVVVQLNSASLVSISISAVSSSGSPVTASLVPTGVCHLPGPFEVVSIAMSVNPASVNGILCGTVVNITYIATVTIAADSDAGTVTLVWNTVYAHTVVTLFFAPAQTVGTVTLTVPQKAEHHSAFPRPVSIASTSPNAYNSAPVQPVGQCT